MKGKLIDELTILYRRIEDLMGKKPINYKKVNAFLARESDVARGDFVRQLNRLKVLLLNLPKVGDVPKELIDMYNKIHEEYKVLHREALEKSKKENEV